MKNYHYPFLLWRMFHSQVTLSEISGRCSLSLHKGKSDKSGI